MSKGKPTILLSAALESRLGQFREIMGPVYGIKAASAGEPLLSAVTAATPHVVLLDMATWEAEGPGLLQDGGVRQVPLLVLAGEDEEARADRAVEQGAADQIPDPPHPAIVRARLGAHLELKQYRDFLRDMSYTDALTGLPNRRRFEEYLELEWRRGVRAAEPLALVLVGIDHYPELVAAQGLAASEEILCQVSDALSRTLQRPGDLLARYLGDRFACILPGTDTVGAVSVAERMRAEVASLDLSHPRSTAGDQVTLSGAALSLVPTSGGSVRAVERLEALLAEAEGRGRNQVCF